LAKDEVEDDAAADTSGRPSGRRRKAQGVENIEARRTSTAMASPDHCPGATILNKTR